MNPTKTITSTESEREHLKEPVSHGTVQFPLAGYNWNGKSNYLVNLHWHDETELLFLEKGVFSLRVNTREYLTEAPAFVFLPAGSIHGLMLEKEQKESAIVFDLHMLSFEHFDSVQFRLIGPLLDGSLQFPLFLTPAHPGFAEIQPLYRRILSLSRSASAVEEALPLSGGPGTFAPHSALADRLRVKGCLYELLAVLAERGLFLRPDGEPSSDSRQLETVKKIISLVEQEYARPIGVEEAASLAGMNPQYFCRYFKKCTGRTLTEYVNEVRIEKAASLLSGTDDRILDIAAACGYETPGYFIRRFRQQKGLSPSQFREKVKIVQ